MYVDIYNGHFIYFFVKGTIPFNSIFHIEFQFSIGK